MLATKSKWAAAVALTLSVLMAGCDDDDDDDDEASKTSMSIKAAKGAVVGATCTVSDPVEETVFDTDPSPVLTGDDGVADFDIVGEIPENSVILVSCVNGEYFNEATGEFEALDPGVSIDSVVPSTDVAAGSASVAVTPLTSIAANLVLDLVEQGVPVDAHAADSANEEISALFGIDDITVPPTTIGSSAPTLGTEPADAYALALASITVAAATEGLDPFAFTAAIEEEIASGTVDTTTLGTALQAATQSYVEDYVEEGATIPPEVVSEVVESQDPQNLDGEVDVEPTSGSS